jgi:murein DD-endopeptidase MepM/ murein hydrolase activator NlpD
MMRLAFALMVLASLSAPLLAKKLYSWTDAKGVKHFSDAPPKDPKLALQLRTRQLQVDPKQVIQLRVEQLPGENRYFAFNKLFAPAQLSVQLNHAQGVRLAPEGPHFMLEPQRERALFSVHAIAQAADYEMSYRITPGSPDAVHMTSAEYRPPFARGEFYVIHQAFGGSFSHSGPENYHAVDFAMPVGSAVHAARAGVVMQIEEDFYQAGTDLEKYGDRANFVAILHADGTFAIYAHLDLERVYVGLGQRVDAGQLMALSGNTGFSTGPHLHFVVQRNAGAKLVSVPFEFTINQQKIKPLVGLALGEKPAPAEGDQAGQRP